MKIINSLACITGAIAIAVGSMTLINKPGAAQNTEFFCGNVDGTPTTMARTNRGNIPIIYWETEYFSPLYTPQRRCEEVSQRFQNFHEKDWLVYLTTGKLNGYNVICVSESPGEHSDRYQLGQAGVLITLTPDDIPGEFLKELMRVRDGAENSPIQHSDSVLIYDSEGHLYINMEEFLHRAATVKDSR